MILPGYVGDGAQKLWYEGTMRPSISKETWQQIKAGYAAGIGLREIARKMNVPQGTVLVGQSVPLKATLLGEMTLKSYPLGLKWAGSFVAS
jgi:hypothetical protein